MSENGCVEDLESVRALVMHAFAGVCPPFSDNITQCPCAECRGVSETLSADFGSNWAEIPAETIAANYDKLPLLSPEAFHYPCLHGYRWVLARLACLGVYGLRLRT